MLTEQEKDHIRLEESYRHDVRKQLEDGADKPQREKTWEFLNSAFFLWFLSSVVIGLGSFGYTLWDKQRDEKQKYWQTQQEENRRQHEQRVTIENENRIIRKKLDTEISSRLVYIHSLTHKEGVVSDPIFEALTVLEKPAESKFPANVIPEHSTRNIPTLLLELIAVLPDETDKRKIQDAYDNSRVFPLQYTMTILNSPEVRSQKTREGEMLDRCGFYKLMNSYFNLDRWGPPFIPKQSDCFPPA